MCQLGCRQRSPEIDHAHPRGWSFSLCMDKCWRRKETDGWHDGAGGWVAKRAGGHRRSTVTTGMWLGRDANGEILREESAGPGVSDQGVKQAEAHCQGSHQVNKQ